MSEYDSFGDWVDSLSPARTLAQTIESEFADARRLLEAAEAEVVREGGNQ